MAPEQYRNPPQSPPVFTATAESILADAKKSAEQSKNILDQIVAKVTPETATFDNTLKPILLDGNDSAGPQNILTFYQHVSTNESLREASTKAEELLSDFYIEAKMREDVFQLVEAAYATRDSQKLDKESLHILEKERQKYIRNGLLLPVGEKRDRFKEIKKRLSQLSIQGKKNLNEEKGGFWFTPKELEGVPKDDIDVETLEKGTGENEGKVKVTFKYNHFNPLVKYAVQEETRRRYVIADANKVRETPPALLS
jgi:metallopeptidase MepB